MPYIDPHHQEGYDEALEPVIDRLNNFGRPPGHLNYVITKILLETRWLESYEEYNEVLGILEAVKQEFYRRKVAPHENDKMHDHGDVFEHDKEF